jgi:hypothetical protein
MPTSTLSATRRLCMAAILVLLVGGVAAGTSRAPAAAALADTPAQNQPHQETANAQPLVDLHRLYNPETGDHFYTTDWHESNIAQANGYRYEWVEAFVHKASGWPGHPLTPLYRLYNPSTGDHFYTTDGDEMFIAQSHGYVYEWIEASVVKPSANVAGYTALYRLYNADTGDHLYTTSLAEADYAESVGYVSEGVACKVIAS